MGKRFGIVKLWRVERERCSQCAGVRYGSGGGGDGVYHMTRAGGGLSYDAGGLQLVCG